MLMISRILPALCVLCALFPSSSLAAQRLPLSRGCSTGIVLTLRAHPDPGRPAGAPAIPRGTIRLRVPLFPRAQPSSRRMPQASFGFPSSWYRKDSRAEYLIPKDWDAVKQWYMEAFTSCGFRPGGSGTSGNRGGIVAQSLSFGFGLPDADQITLTFEQAGATHTLVLYAASAITLPPPQVLVPGSPMGATVSYYGSRGPDATPRAVVSVRSGVAISYLAGALNHLPVADEPGYCPLDLGGHDRIVFRYVRGRTRAIDVSTGGCRYVMRGTTLAAHSTAGLLQLLARIERGG